MRFNKFFVFLLGIGLVFALATDLVNASDEELPDANLSEEDLADDNLSEGNAENQEKLIVLDPEEVMINLELSSIENLVEYLLQMRNPDGKNCMNYLEEIEEKNSYKLTKEDLTKKKLMEKLSSIKETVNYILQSKNPAPGENGRKALEMRKKFNQKFSGEKLREIKLKNYELTTPDRTANFEKEELMKKLSSIDISLKYLLNSINPSGTSNIFYVQTEVKGYMPKKEDLTLNEFIEMLASIENKLQFIEQIMDPTGEEGRKALEMRKKYNEYQSQHKSPAPKLKEIVLDRNIF